MRNPALVRYCQRKADSGQKEVRRRVGGLLSGRMNKRGVCGVCPSVSAHHAAASFSTFLSSFFTVAQQEAEEAASSYAVRVCLTIKRIRSVQAGSWIGPQISCCSRRF